MTSAAIRSQRELRRPRLEADSLGVGDQRVQSLCPASLPPPASAHTCFTAANFLSRKHNVLNHVTVPTILGTKPWSKVLLCDYHSLGPKVRCCKSLKEFLEWSPSLRRETAGREPPSGIWPSLLPLSLLPPAHLLGFLGMHVVSACVCIRVYKCAHMHSHMYGDQGSCDFLYCIHQVTSAIQHFIFNSHARLCTHTCHGVHVEVRGYLPGVGSCLPPC